MLLGYRKSTSGVELRSLTIMLAVSFGGAGECGVDANVERLDLDPNGHIEVSGGDLPVLASGDPG